MSVLPQGLTQTIEQACCWLTGPVFLSMSVAGRGTRLRPPRSSLSWRRSRPPTASPGSCGSLLTTGRTTAPGPSPPWPHATRGSVPTPHGTTARSSATTASWQRSASTRVPNSSQQQRRDAIAVWTPLQLPSTPHRLPQPAARHPRPSTRHQRHDLIHLGEAPTPSGTRAARPSRRGIRLPIPARGGPSGFTHPSASPRTTRP